MSFVDDLYNSCEPRKAASEQEMAEAISIIERVIKNKVAHIHRTGKRTCHGYLAADPYDKMNFMLFDYDEKPIGIPDHYSGLEYYPVEILRSVIEKKMVEDGFRNVRVDHFSVPKYQTKEGFLGKKIVNNGTVKTLEIELSW